MKEKSSEVYLNDSKGGGVMESEDDSIGGSKSLEKKTVEKSVAESDEEHGKGKGIVLKTLEEVGKKMTGDDDKEPDSKRFRYLRDKKITYTFDLQEAGDDEHFMLNAIKNNGEKIEVGSVKFIKSHFGI
ncbi:MAG: hypothetical protein V3V41_05435 [Candidatus Heimdallarchaeota archaeon]